jgi:predicted PurR-regulated permease PerM
MRYFDHDKLRQLSFLIILLVLGAVLFIELRGFIPAFLGALTLYVLMRNWMFRMVYTRKWSPSGSAALLMTTSFFIIMVPVWMIVNMLNSVNSFVSAIEHRTGFKLISEENLKSAGTFLAQNIPMLLGATFNTLVSIAMMYFILYFMLVNGKKMEKACAEFVPMGNRNTDKVGKEINNMVVSNAIGIPLIALAQGLVGLIGYWMLGLNEPLFWFVITTITAMLPVVGAALAYVPISIIFFAQGPAWKGIVMLIYGFGVIGTVDNLFRMVLNRKLGDIHPLITILGVIAGLGLFGFIGLIFGPLLLSLFVLLIKIYSLEFVEKESKNL